MTVRIPPHSDARRTTLFGIWLTRKREERGWWQDELAHHLGLKLDRHFDSGRICEWEKGDRVPRPAVVRALWELLDPTGPEPPHPVKANRRDD